MELFLREQKNKLPNEDKVFEVVLGNESCDLDSVISSITFAYFIYKLKKSSDIILPVLNVIKEDLPLRTEVVHFLKKTNIPIEDLVCKDEINLQTLKDQKRLKLILVDHNSLSDDQADLNETIIQVVDHHKINNPESLNRIKSTVENVGSCATLIAEEMLQSPHLMDFQVALLLLGTILLDTVCLEESAKRVTEKDKVVAAQLETYLTDINKEELFQELLHAKFNTSTLSFEQLLRRDTKYISNGDTNVALASLPMLLEGIVQDHDFISSLKEFSFKKNLSFLIILGSQVLDDKGLLRRQIAIFDASQRFLEKVSKFLKSLQNPSLRLRPMPTCSKDILFFEQENAVLSRKFVLPAIQQYISSETCLS